MQVGNGKDYSFKLNKTVYIFHYSIIQGNNYIKSQNRKLKLKSVILNKISFFLAHCQNINGIIIKNINSIYTLTMCRYKKGTEHQYILLYQNWET